MMESGLTYVEYFIFNASIWNQALFVGVGLMGVCCLMGMLVSSTVRFFRMVSR